MKILAVECSAGPASCAVIENGKILSNAFINVKLTHSQTLMPMVESVLTLAKLTLEDIDSFAVACGPGSFTGIRIGIAAIKGLATPKNTPCAAISTLEGMAYNFKDINGILCCVMDARCNQVYNALFKIGGGVITRLCEDRAVMCEELAEELKNNYSNQKIIVAGDGTDVFFKYVNDIAVRAENTRLYQNAVGIALAAELAEPKCCAADLNPVYLRLPQAERELKAKNERKEIK